MSVPTCTQELPFVLAAGAVVRRGRVGAPATVGRLGALVALCAMPVAAAWTANFEVNTRSVPGLTARSAITTHTLRLTGMIEEGDAERLRAILAGLKAKTPPAPGKPLATIELSSRGGDLLEGFKLGYLFREFDVATVVRKGDSCLSSCALAFLGGTISHLPPNLELGRSLEVGGSLGFHNFYLNPNHERSRSAASPQEGIAKGFNEARGGAAVLARYIAFMGIDAGFIARMLGRPPEEWEYVSSAATFIDLKICPVGFERPPVPPQTVAVNICNNATGWFTPPSALRARYLTAGEAKRHLLEEIRRNIESFNVKGPLAAQLGAVLASRDYGLIDSVYADLRRAGLVLPDIVGTTYLVSGYSAGAYGLECLVSFQSDNPDKFDLVLDGPGGGSKAVNQPPPLCPGLFAHDRDDTLNPGR